MSLRGVRPYVDSVAIVEIKNEGSIAAGVEIEVIERDENGILVGSAQFWLNSIYNIAPGETRGIEHTITKDKYTRTIEAKVISLEIWDGF